MPFVHTCTEHPDWTGEVLTDAQDHLRSEHGNARLDSGLVSSRFVRQSAGTARRFGCRSCGVLVDTDDPNRPPYCDDHLEARP